MLDIDKAILLLKQYGTPVWKGAMTAAKVSAVIKFSWSIILFVLAATILKLCWKETNDKDMKAIITIIVVALTGISIALGMDGLKEIFSLDFQAYKLMLFK